MVASSDAASASLMERLRRCNILVVGGSGDSVATGAAVLRLMGHDTQVHVVTPSPKFVSDLEPQRWPRDSRVVIVGVAVAKPNPDVTTSFVQRVHEAGHRIEAIIDEHSRAEWGRVVAQVGFELSDLAIEPQSQQDGEFRSSGAVLRAALSEVEGFDDDHILKLLHVAELCDSREFDADGLASMLNAALKSRTGCPRVRTHLVVKLAQSLELTRQTERWVREYRWILRRHRRILAKAQDLGDGLLRLNIDGPVDMARLTRDALMKTGTRVLVMKGQFHDSAAKKAVPKVAFGTNEKLSLLTVLRSGYKAQGGKSELQGVRATGFERKPMVMAEDEVQAVRIIRRLLRSSEEASLPRTA